MAARKQGIIFANRSPITLLLTPYSPFVAMRFLLFLFAFIPQTVRPHAGVMLKSPELKGIDVSHYQESIEWDTVVAKQRPDFVFVKCTEGSDYTDSLYCQNWEALGRLGVRRGAYHFFRAYGCGDVQAWHFLQTADLKPGDLAPVLDMETTSGVEPEMMIEEARVWLQIVEEQLGVKPIVYSSHRFYERYLAGHFDDYPLWIARYSDEAPALASGKIWNIWQYSNQGCYDGICRKVDVNVFPGTSEMLDQLCCKHPQTDCGSVTP